MTGTSTLLQTGSLLRVPYKHMDNMGQKAFVSAFENFISEPEDQPTESEEQEADAFVDEQEGYDEDDTADEYDDQYEEDDELEDDDQDYEEEDEEEESSRKASKLEKRLKDKDKYISELQSKIDKFQNTNDQIQQQLNYLLSNQQTNQQTEDYDLDLGEELDPDDFGSYSEFEKKKEKQEKLKLIQKKAKEKDTLQKNLEMRVQNEFNYIQKQSDYNDVNERYKKMSASGEDTEILTHLQSQPLGLYYYIKNKMQEESLTNVKKRLKKRKQPVPETNTRRSVGRAKKSKRSGFERALEKNMLHDDGSFDSLDLI
jgi:hypothetical protein